jgi:hypothetical protein
MNLKLLILTLLILSTLNAQDIFNNCGMEGDAKHPAVKILNLKKNRYEAPKQSDYDTKVTLSAMLAPGDDENRWGDSKAAEVTGYVYDVKPGGIESVNCHARDLYYRDTHQGVFIFFSSTLCKSISPARISRPTDKIAARWLNIEEI